MALQFEGAFDHISEPQLAFIRDVLEKRGYKDNKVTFEVVGQAGDNYVANVKRIVVTDANGEFRMIAKISPQHEMIRAAMKTEKLFRNEHIMYTIVLPKFQQLEEQANVPKEDRLRFAECYGSFTTAPYEVILLEDLVVLGFSMQDRFKPLSDECVKSVLRNFALLHSLSYVLKQKEPETFNEYKDSLFDMWSNMEGQPDSTMYFERVETTAVMVVDGEDRKKLVKGCILQALSLGAKLAKQDAGSKYSVIQQGDSWTNNILFKLKEDSLEESVLIDYQVSKVSNPTYDLMYMIFNCTNHKSRLEHFNDWIDYYYSELEKALANYDLKANYVYSRDQLDADMRRFAKVMFGISVILAISLILKPEEAAKMKESLENPVDSDSVADTAQFDEETTQIFKTRLEGLIDSFVKFGLF